MAILLAGIFIAICLFYYLDQKRKIRKEQLKERSREKFEHLLATLKRGNKDQNLQVSTNSPDSYRDNSSNVVR
jgi:hypothetical protein